ncbi:MAG: hypothetical protein COY75_05105 [Nitrospirae bacterium CG_4_10_14_0_8_um_filter_41_23]|nr:hypothetical protein [Nitrospirota bacterium]OIP61268.1 MAG: hypothetical protein AUK38_01120 [Nitrospirae bacterium CG2_30_41_42]PIQ94761.1 MAG: hypothetical protein COV68_02885 [Nitrospirae bacterium CG11_big_fil_rev_8_21_14_0_20_41_14]PIV43034.1 MAG: hypothetical protein COS27_05825 [Nitrospirae bacterium CG02_land_8_20_14_3_00_41_53]PIW88134.1 MAG: hypothetical protein COZ94_01415 [Nitrospirae bacterium CG_4_8_14_3_um_filter_41_47]PIY87005.1 MAG: hypothetical protein COY75_05105 [Nitros
MRDYELLLIGLISRGVLGGGLQKLTPHAPPLPAPLRPGHAPDSGAGGAMPPMNVSLNLKRLLTILKYFIAFTALYVPRGTYIIKIRFISEKRKLMFHVERLLKG